MEKSRNLFSAGSSEIRLPEAKIVLKGRWYGPCTFVLDETGISSAQAINFKLPPPIKT